MKGRDGAPEAGERRGEWKVTHQGLAFYKDGKIADGQHRLAAVAESGTDQRFVMFPNFEDGAVDAIDIGKARSAGDAVQLLGIEDAKFKAAVSRAVVEYAHEIETGRKLNPTIIQIERSSRPTTRRSARRLELPGRSSAGSQTPV